MKKIVALVLAMVMVLGLATTAFGAITLWAPNGSTVKCDVYEAAYNTKIADGVSVTYNPGTALAYNVDGSVKTVGEIAHYVYAGNTYVLASSIPADATAADVAKYILVKAYDATVKVGEKAPASQSAKDAYYILKAVENVKYVVTATEFTDWSTACEGYAKPVTAKATDKFYTVANKVTGVVADTTVKYIASTTGVNALVGDEVVVMAATAIAPTQHAWVASAWNAKKVVTEYTCVNCKTVGTVVNSPLNAPAGAKLDNFMGTLIAYNFPVVEAPATDKVESAQTFDAGIAMYVGMSVMAAAGSAVVLKKKD